MTPLRRRLILIGVVIIAAILAFPLRDAIYGMVVVPASYVAWNLNLVYQSFSQGIWWWVIVFLVLFMIALSLAPRPQFRSRVGPRPKPAQGPVENLSVWLHRAESGVYFKWLVANRLGKLAYQILLHRENGGRAPYLHRCSAQIGNLKKSCRTIWKQVCTGRLQIFRAAGDASLLHPRPRLILKW